MLEIKFVIRKFLFKNKFLLSCLGVIWITGTIITIYPKSWKAQTKFLVQKLVHPTVDHEEVNHELPILDYGAEAINYCNPPNTIKRGDEGKQSIKGSLELVAVMFRHGDRAPLQLVRNQFTIDCGTKESLILKKYLKTLTNLQESTKHLSLFRAFPLHPDLKICNITKMTLLGAHQHLMVGQALKKSYIDEHNLLSTNWSSSDIKVYSSPYSRTFQSALAFLFGFLPNFNISNISIIPTLDFRFCMSPYYCNCPLSFHLDELEEQKELFLLRDSAVSKIMQDLIPIIKYDSKQPSIWDPFYVFDALMVYVCHNTPLPCMPDTNDCATFEHLHNIIKYLKWKDQQLLKNSILRVNVLIKSQGFLQHLIHTINNYISSKHSSRFILYSAHDLTLRPLLSILGIYDGGLIPYASRIAFEVYSHVGVDNEVQYSLKIVYQGIDVTKEVSFCKPYFKPSKEILDNSEHGLCPFESFKKFVADLVPSTGFSSFNELCN